MAFTSPKVARKILCKPCYKKLFRTRDLIYTVARTQDFKPGSLADMVCEDCQKKISSYIKGEEIE